MDENKALQDYQIWFLSVRRHVARLSGGLSAKRLAGPEFYREMHLDGFRPDQAAKEAVWLWGKED